VWRRALWLYSAPRRAFSPPLTHSTWIVALAVLFVVLFAQAVLVRDLVAEKQRPFIESNDRIPEERKEEILARMQSPENYAVLSVIGTVVQLLFGYIIPALLFLFGLNFVLASSTTFKEVLSVTSLCGLALIPGDLLRTPLMLAKGTLDVYTSPAAFADPNNLPLVFALNRFDIFELYRLVLLALGLSVLARQSTKRTAILVGIVWLIFGLIGFGSVKLSSAFSQGAH